MLYLYYIYIIYKWWCFDGVQQTQVLLFGTFWNFFPLIFLIRVWLNPWVWNLQAQMADCTTHGPSSKTMAPGLRASPCETASIQPINDGFLLFISCCKQTLIFASSFLPSKALLYLIPATPGKLCSASIEFSFLVYHSAVNAFLFKFIGVILFVINLMFSFSHFSAFT